ncbi:hypothetical protein O181_046676 [Austropuccinia psidii MF-1]|uniref:Uncharacterized protein n=1 Tax=Austropuccinia psidii MF-1 TaxID=1389203 RepID=A0A9Q3DUN8_9BASI|nr:hypothetical protein [Austropuccinia psidii MF-1]
MISSLKSISLILLCLHYSALTILLHLSRINHSSHSSYRPSSAVVLTELFKLIISFSLACRDSLIQFNHQLKTSSHSQFNLDSVNLDQSQNHHNSQNINSNLILSSINQVDHHQIQSNHSSEKIRQRTFSSDLETSPNSNGKRKRSTNQTQNLIDLKQDNFIFNSFNSAQIDSLNPTQLTPQLNQINLNSIPVWCHIYQHLHSSIFSPRWWLLSIPAILFVIQNNLQYLAASNLSVPLFQITYQLKILTTAICSVFLLKRALKITQWIALIFLTFGVAIVQLHTQTSSPINQASQTEQQSHSNKMNQSLGLIAVLLACLSSGFASVYFERAIKSAKKPSTIHPSTAPTQLEPSTTIWIRNIQLSIFGFLSSLLIVLFEDYFSHKSHPSIYYHLNGFRGGLIATRSIAWFKDFFQGFSTLTWLVIFFQVTGGLLNALVINCQNSKRQSIACKWACRCLQRGICIFALLYYGERTFMYNPFLTNP